MDFKELHQFRINLEKKASFGQWLLKSFRRLPKPISKGLKKPGKYQGIKSGLSMMGIGGTVGVGGIGYGAIKGHAPLPYDKVN